VEAMGNKNYLVIIRGSALNRGMNTGLENLAWGLADRGNMVYILAGGHKPDSHHFKLSSNITYEFTGLSGKPESFVDAYLKIIREIPVDIVIGRMSSLALLTHLKNKANKQLYYIANEGSMSKYSLKKRISFGLVCSLLKNLLKGNIPLLDAISILVNKSKFYSKIDRVISITKAVQINLIESYSVNPLITLVIPRGIDTDIYAFKKRTQNLEIPIRILYAGVIIELKGIDDIIDSVVSINTPIEVVFCGYGNKNYIRKIKYRFSSFNSESRIVFRGPLNQKDLIFEYQNCDVFVFPSRRSEGLGKALIEAMSCGCPVIVSDFDPFKEVITPGENGLMVPVNSPEKLAAAIQAYISNPELRITCSYNARKTVERRFSKESEIDKWLETISQYEEKCRI